ncbi:MAG TPA: amino acid adenylation domain-containing protein, partial [Rugosimonospora sp.]|nr:amino acid adenylation domain-containing protein [Rugosimonospora sp.]
RGLGVGRGDIVAVCADRGAGLLAGLLGVLKAGAAYLPLEPGHPERRRAFLIADSGARALLTQASLAPAEAPPVPVVLLDDPDLSTLDGGDLGVPVDPDDLVYTIYTSGSTGAPKGVLVTHGGLTNYLCWARDEYGVAAEHGAPLFGSVAYDLAVPSFLLPLISGRDVLAVAADRDQAGLARVLRGAGPVSFVKITPAHLDLLAAAVTEDGSTVDSVGALVVGGEEMQPDMVAAWRRALPGARIYNEYGPTETVVGCVVYQAPSTMDPKRPVPIGTPIAGARAYVLDRAGQPVPAGVIGELYLGGTGVARGYLGRPGATAAAFLPDPYGPPGSRMYRTGDLARHRDGGVLEFLGRGDDQVKIRGYRVELGEIEARLLGAPGVAEAVVVARADRPGERRLVGYVTARDGERVEPGRLRAYLGQVLPEHMVPAAFCVLDALPLRPSGKVDRAALPEPERADLAPGREYLPPRGHTERVLAGIWAQVLRVDRVGVHDGFFALGGDSITVLPVIALAREAGLPLSLRLLYAHETLGELAAALGGEPVWAPALASEGARVAAVPDLSTRDAVEAAVRRLIARHDALRLRRGPDGWSVAREVTGPVLTELSAPDTDPAAVAVAALDPGQGRMIHAVLGPDGAVLAVSAAAADEDSWAILLADLASADKAGGERAATTPYRTWARRLAEHAEAPETAAQVPGWLNRMPCPPLPVDRPAGTDTYGRAVTVTLSLSKARTAALAGRGEEALLAAVSEVLAGWAGGNRLLVEVERDGREPFFDGVDLTGTVGAFRHRYPLALWLPARRDPATVLGTVRAQLRAVPDDGIGFELLRAQEGGELAGLETPEVLVRFRERRPAQAPELVVDPGGTRPYPMEVRGEVVAGRLRVAWTYPGARYRRATVRALRDALRTRLEELADAATPVASSRPVRRVGDRAAVAVEPVSPLPVMRRLGVPGASVALIRDGDVADCRGYGESTVDGPAVTAGTLFPAGSVSKFVTALGVLRLAQEGRLDLDADVNGYLTSWHPPRRTPVTARQLLRCVSGLAVPPRHVVYHPGEPLPTVTEVLHGTPPARNEPVDFVAEPGTAFLKNNVSFSVLQQLLCDLTGEAFPELMHRLVLAPLGMTASGFRDEPSGHAAVGHDESGNPLPYRWLVHPEAAAAGLWTTAGDLARALVEVRRAYRGEPGRLIGRELAGQMLTVVEPCRFYGLGAVVDGTGEDLEFGHTGQTGGYRAAMLAQIDGGTGVVALVNADSGREVLTYLVGALRRQDAGFGRGESAMTWERGLVQRRAR